MNDIRPMVEEVVRDLVADIAKAHSTEYGNCRKPIPVKYKMHELVHRGRECGEYCGWRYSPKFIRWEVVVVAMEKKVQGDTNAVIRKIPSVVT